MDLWTRTDELTNALRTCASEQVKLLDYQRLIETVKDQEAVLLGTISADKLYSNEAMRKAAYAERVHMIPGRDEEYNELHRREVNALIAEMHVKIAREQLTTARILAQLEHEVIA